MQPLHPFNKSFILLMPIQTNGSSVGPFFGSFDGGSQSRALGTLKGSICQESHSVGPTVKLFITHLTPALEEYSLKMDTEV